MDFHVTDSDGYAFKLLEDLAHDDVGCPWWVIVDHDPHQVSDHITVEGYLMAYSDKAIIMQPCHNDYTHNGPEVTIPHDHIWSVTVPC